MMIGNLKRGSVLRLACRQVYYPQDIILINRLIERNAEGGLESSVRDLCRVWQWFDQWGNYCEADCLHVINLLSANGLITLSADEIKKSSRITESPRPPEMEIDRRPLSGNLSVVSPLEVRLVSTEAEERVCDYVLSTYHYLGNRTLIGPSLKYIVYSGERPVAAMSWGVGSLKLSGRDELMRRLGVAPPSPRNVAANHRYVIVPWVRIRCLSSHILSLVVRRIAGDWRARHDEELQVLETFVDPLRFDGTSYRAANWLYAGMTAGSGKTAGRYHYHGSAKMLYLYPLSPSVRRRGAAASRSPPPMLQTPPSPPEIADSSHFLPYRIVTLHNRKGEIMSTVKPTIFPSTQAPGAAIVEEDFDAAERWFEEYWEHFADLWSNVRNSAKSNSYVRSLVQTLRRKSVQSMALNVMADVPVRTMQYHLTGSAWRHEPILVRLQRLVVDALSEPDGVLILDPSCFPKQGAESAGVGKQYCGARGKIENCQKGVFLCYSSSKGTTFVDTRLYMPPSWFSREQKEQRWKRCHIPEDLTFKTSQQLGVEMIANFTERHDDAYRWVLADAEFGVSPAFLDGLPEGKWYLCGVPGHINVWTQRPKTAVYAPEYCGRGQPPKKKMRLLPGEPSSRSIDSLIDHPDLEWRLIERKNGAKGIIRIRAARLRVVEKRDDLPADDVWLFIRHELEKDDYKFMLSNAPLDISLEEMAEMSLMRWPIETCIQEGKSELGMDQYETRSWVGWYRHMTLVFLAHVFLILVRNRIQKKTPRSPFDRL